MKILVNATPLLAPRSGVGRYVYSLSERLLQIDHNNEYHFFAGTRFGRELPNVAWEGSSARAYSKLRQQLRSLKGYSFWVDWSRRKLFELGGQVQGYGLYHELNSVPLGFPAPVVLTVLDLSIKHYPETHPAIRVEIFNRYFYRSLSRVKRIITVSHAVKTELVELLNIPSEKIDVIHLAADNCFRPLPKAQVSAYLQQRGLPEAYILYVGTIEPRKNLAHLIRAYAALPASTRARCPLILAGVKGWPGDESPYQALAALAEDLDISHQIRFTGFVPEAELPWLYNGASAFAFPSVYEGFGLPPLEAMQSGLPVLVSTAPALMEVVGEAGLCVPSDDIEGWAASLERLLSQPALREELSARGQERAQSFSWEKCARQTLASYRVAMAG